MFLAIVALGAELALGNECKAKAASGSTQARMSRMACCTAPNRDLSGARRPRRVHAPARASGSLPVLGSRARTYPGAIGRPTHRVARRGRRLLPIAAAVVELGVATGGRAGVHDDAHWRN